MARLPRLIVPQQPHHVIQWGNSRQPVFIDDEDRTVFLGKLREGGKQFGVAIHAYVLMPDHFHLLATPQSEEALGRLIQWMGRYYVPYFNRKYDRSGTLWQGRYRATVVESEKYFLLCSSYIELNPVRAGIAIDPAAYPWSSYLHHIGLKADPLIVDHVLYWALGNTPFERELAYRKLTEQGISKEELKLITDATVKGWALGSPSFLSNLEERIGRRVQPTKRGRPRKAQTSAVSDIIPNNTHQIQENL